MSQETDTPVIDLLARMNLDAIETTTLDPEQAMLVRIAALVAMDAPPASYMLNLSVAGQVDVGAEEIQGVLAAIAPIVGSPRVVGAAETWCAPLASRSILQSSRARRLKP